MSKYKRLTDGFWFYKVFDVDTGELLTQGNQTECCRKMQREINHYCNVVYYAKRHPNIVPKWERVERYWIPYFYEVTDKRTGEKVIGSKEECRKMMEKALGRELDKYNFINYWYGSVDRFDVIQRYKVEV